MVVARYLYLVSRPRLADLRGRPVSPLLGYVRPRRRRVAAPRGIQCGCLRRRYVCGGRAAAPSGIAAAFHIVLGTWLPLNLSSRKFALE